MREAAPNKRMKNSSTEQKKKTKITNDSIISNGKNQHATIERNQIDSQNSQQQQKYTRVKDFYNSYVKNWNDCDLSRDI